MSISQALANAIVDPQTYSRSAEADALFARLRRESPFALAHPEGYDPFWIATKHADVLEIERRSDEFLNGAGSVIIFDRASIDYSISLTGEPNVTRSMVEVDGEEHRALRSVTFGAFQPRSIAVMEESIRGIARKTIGEMLNRGGNCDFARDVAYVYPLRAVMSALGNPPEDEAFLLRTAHAMHSPSDPDFNQSPEAAMESIQAAVNDLEAYYQKVAEHFRSQPGACVNSLIANAKINGEFLTQRQLMGYYIITATAGHDTTAFTLATAMWILAERPELLSRLKREPEDIPAFVEETIRWATPVKSFMRTAVQDADVNGHPINKGDWLMLSYASANRDEDVFERPFEFDIDRPRGNKHVSFGHGPHVCLGQHLARLEMRILWEELLPKLQSVELAGAVKSTVSNFVCGPKAVPIRFAA